MEDYWSLSNSKAKLCKPKPFFNLLTKRFWNRISLDWVSKETFFPSMVGGWNFLSARLKKKKPMTKSCFLIDYGFF